MLLTVLLLTLLLWSGGPGLASGQSSPCAQAPRDSPMDFVTGEILVQFRPGTPAPTIAEVHRQNGGQVKEVIPGIDVQVIRVAAGQEAASVAAYERNPNVVFAELNGCAAAQSDE
jgi:hypothetical protein